MKHLCCKNSFFLLFFILFFSKVLTASAYLPKSAVVYYANNHPFELLGSFDIIILDSANTDSSSHGFKKYKDKIFAYVSIGEVNKNRSYYKMIKKEWIKSENRVWKSKVVDISNKDYQKFLIDVVLKDLIKRGYKNFFFDTVDSFYLFKAKDEKTDKYEDAIVNFLKEIKKRYKGVRIILNRGFEIIEKGHSFIDGVLFESLFYGLDPKTLKYIKVPPKDREWLLLQVEKIKKYDIPVIALDYLPPNERQKAKENAKKIAKLGIIPYIADRDLQTVGVSVNTPLKREVLVLYESDFKKVEYSPVFNFCVPLEYMGYIPSFVNLAKEDFPKSTIDKYAGVIIWKQKDFKNKKKFSKYLEKVLKSGVKILFLSDMELKSRESKLLGLEAREDEGDFKIAFKDKMIGFEIVPKIPHRGKFLRAKDAKSVLKIKKMGVNLFYDMAAVTKWGGFFDISPFVKVDNLRLWSVDPFELFKKTLRLKSFPIPDTTTQNGKRVMFVYVGCKGFDTPVEFKPKYHCKDMLLKEVIKRYKIPQTLCVKDGKFKKKVSKLPYVKSVEKIDLLEGYTKIGNNAPWLTLISPTGIKKEGRYKIFFPISDENAYTNWWQDTFWGFENVTGTFKLTDEPKRLKPIAVCYHYYSASKMASLNALLKVYKWVLSQDIEPIFADEYIKKALDFYDVAIAETSDGFVIDGALDLRTFRVDKRVGIDMQKSRGVKGYKDLKQGRYIDVSGDKRVFLSLCR